MRKPREIKTCDKSVEKILSNGDLVSNLLHPCVNLKRPNSPDTPYVFLGHYCNSCWVSNKQHYLSFWVTLTHTPALPIHNEPNYQELKRRKRNIHTQPTPEWKRARERGRKRVLYQSVTTKFRLNSLSIKIQSDITRIYFERWSPLQSRGRGERGSGGFL